jgi:hypothetical protein
MCFLAPCATEVAAWSNPGIGFVFFSNVLTRVSQPSLTSKISSSVA